MKKIVIFIPTLSLAGAEKFVVDLALNLDKSKYIIIVALTYKNDKTYFSTLLRNNNINIICFEERNIIIKTFKIFRFLKMTQADIVHTNLGSHLHSFFAIVLARVKIRIYTFHSNAERSAGRNTIKRFFYSISFKFFKFTPVAISNYVKESIVKEYNLPRSKIVCIFNGVNTVDFEPNIEKNNDNNCFNFVSIGTLYQIKNHKLLIQAFIETERIYSNISLNIIGDGELRRDLEMMIKKAGLEKKIHMLGSINNVVDYLRKADVYIMSSNIEGFSLATLEAMSCGLPIITTKAGGIVDIVEDGYNGFVTPVGDFNALSNAMVDLILDKDLRIFMGINSRQKALKLDIHNCAKKYQELYDNGIVK